MAVTEIEHHHDSSSGMGFFLGIVVLAILAFLLFYYGLPAVRNSGTTMNVPSKVDVNVTNPK